MKYTIEDLRGKYVKPNTPEAEVFLDACEEIGVVWCNGRQAPRGFTPSPDNVIEICNDGNDTLSQECIDYSHGFEFTPFTIKKEWTIYNNDKPLRELSDEQAAEMFNAWRAGEKLESALQKSVNIETGDVRITFADYAGSDWYDNVVYRIKQKSEREMFIETAMKHGGLRAMDGAKEVYARLFDSEKFQLIKDVE